jgi:hypothetical protein
LDAPGVFTLPSVEFVASIAANGSLELPTQADYSSIAASITSAAATATYSSTAATADSSSNSSSASSSSLKLGLGLGIGLGIPLIIILVAAGFWYRRRQGRGANKQTSGVTEKLVADDDRYGNEREEFFAPHNNSNDWKGRRPHEVGELDAQRAPAELDASPNVASELDSTQVHSSSSRAANTQNTTTSDD